ncbi:MAG: hypothetical protein JXA71_09080 [Chitinispirillaceae bacterium]|nr:hypothetical protein [Chitinispirillaceae bacterium]
MSTGKAILPLILGLVLVAGAGMAFFFLPGLGPDHPATGAVVGFGVAYLGFLLYYLLLPFPAGKNGSFFASYLPGAVARYVVMISAFCTVVFLFKIHTLGVLLGTFIGMMVSTFVSLNSMRRKPQKSPEA